MINPRSFTKEYDAMQEAFNTEVKRYLDDGFAIRPQWNPVASDGIYGGVDLVRRRTVIRVFVTVETVGEDTKRYVVRVGKRIGDTLFNFVRTEDFEIVYENVI